MNCLSRIAADLALLTLLGTVANGQTTWHVDMNGTPPGAGTQADPFVTIMDAVDAPTTLAGDTILVGPGVYEEGTITILKDITLASAQGPLQTHLRDTLVRMGQNEFQSPTIDGFTISNSDPDPDYPDDRLIWIFRGTVRRCVIRDTNGTGLFITDDVVVDQTTFVNLRQAVSGFGLGFGLTMRNSIVWGQDFGSTTPAWGAVDYNAGHPPLLWGEPGTGNVIGDPGFWSDTLGDLRLRTGSPCIDAGDPTSPLDGDGSVTDMGAMAYDAAYEPGAYSFCSPSEHSTGSGASMSMAGQRSLAANDFTLMAVDCPPNKVGLFYYGPNEIQAAFGDGLRCVGGMTTRIYPAVFADGSGTAARPLNFTQPPVNAGNGMITSGSTWKFQFWFRDGMGPGGTGYNLSDGLSVTFTP